MYSDEGLLAPRLLPQTRLDRLYAELWPETFDANFNKRPCLSQFALIKPEMFAIVPTVPENQSRLYVFFDGALTAGKRSDFSAAIACVSHLGTVYITGIFQRKLEYNELKMELVDLIRSLQGFDVKTQVFIEPKA